MFVILNHGIKLCLDIDNKFISFTSQVNSLGITIDSKLKFDNHAKKPGVSKKTGVLMLFMGLQDICRNLRKGYCIICFSFQTLNSVP